MQTSTDYGKRKMNLISTMLRIFIIVAIIMPCECCVCGSDCGRTAIMYSNHVKSLPDQRSAAIQQFSIITFFHGHFNSYIISLSLFIYHFSITHSLCLSPSPSLCTLVFLRYCIYNSCCTRLPNCYVLLRCKYEKK